MGCTVSSLQILGTTEEAVQAALPESIVGKWSERFITACHCALSFGPMEQTAKRLSRKLNCTVLTVSMFDSDFLSLALYDAGKRMTRHVSGLEPEACVMGNARAFCAGLGLQPQTAPLLKRLFTEQDQEEKLRILSQLLGAPLFACWDDPLTAPLPQSTDDGPLLDWIAAHPVAPKVRNRPRVEMVQEIAERSVECMGSALILRPLDYADEQMSAICGCAPGTVLGICCSGGEWARWDGDGRLQQTPLVEDDRKVYAYAEANGRLLSLASDVVEYESGCYTSGPPSVVLDSDGKISTPLPLAPPVRPMDMQQCVLLLNGSFLVTFRPQNGVIGSLMRCYSAEGSRLWDWRGQVETIAVTDDRIYLTANGADGQMLHCLTMTGQRMQSIRITCEGPLLVSGRYLYQLASGGYRKDDSLCRFTRDLEDAGQLRMSGMSAMDCSPDGSLLVCAGDGSGLAVVDLETFQLRQEVRNRNAYNCVMVDGRNRIWAHTGSMLECYSADLELLSRHQLAGDIVSYMRNRAGELCIAVYQKSKYLTKVYRLCGKS